MAMLIKEEGPNEYGHKIYTFEGGHALEVPARYQVKDFIGRGAYGIVCSAINTDNGDRVAIKRISRLFEDAVDGKRVLREVQLLAFLSHPNVLQLKDICRPPNPKTFNDLYVVTELMETDMQVIIRSPRIRLTAGHCQYFTLQLLYALQYVHSAHVLHRDLKPSNLLTDADCNLKLCDFGLARGNGEHLTNYVVTRWYRPPELLLVCEHYDYSVDMWGVGCLATEMITGKTLLAGHDYIHQVNLIVQLLGVPDLATDLPTVTSPEAQRYIKSLPPTPRKSLAQFVPDLRRRFNDASFFDSFDEPQDTPRREKSPEQYFKEFEEFVFGFLCYNPTKRRTAKEAVMHPWLADVRGDIIDLDANDAGRYFAWAYDEAPLSIEQLRTMFLELINNFHASRSTE